MVEPLRCVLPSLPRVGGWTSTVCPAFSPTGWWLNLYGVSCLLSHGLVLEPYDVSCFLSHEFVVEPLRCVLPSLPRVGGWTSTVCPAFSPTSWWLNLYGVCCNGWTSMVCPAYSVMTKTSQSHRSLPPPLLAAPLVPPYPSVEPAFLLFTWGNKQLLVLSGVRSLGDWGQYAHYATKSLQASPPLAYGSHG